MEKSACLLIALFSMLCILTADAKTGACYGTLGKNLPSPREMIALCNRYNIRLLRIYNPNPTILEALQGTNISVIVGVVNNDIPAIAQSFVMAENWIKNNILKYPNVNFRYIAVGNELLPSEADPSLGIAPSVPLAMEQISNALAKLGQPRIKVSTSLSMGIMGQSYPPSAGAFKPVFRNTFIDPIIRFLVKTNSPMLINIYPYFAYAGDTTNIKLDYALFTSKSTVKDGVYEYQNLFDAMLDSVHAALEKAGGGNVEVVVSETGWPSAGGTETTVANALAYNSNLIKSLKRGTPRKPGKAIEAYIFDLIDEDAKSPDLEKHWGIFLANKQPKYPLSFTA